ncbi:MAG: 50S ribosomal protein L10 [Nitrospinaceae bacterium]
MPTPEKKEAIDELSRVFAAAKSGILADYQGIKAQELTRLRRHLKERSLDFRVIKNTLAQKAAKDTPFESMEAQFKGPVSLLVSYEDIVAPAKALADFAKSGAEKSPKVLCGIIEGKAVSAEGVKALATLPSKEQLIAQLLSVMQGPTRNFVGVLSGVTRQFVGVLQAIKDKKEEEGGGSA